MKNFLSVLSNVFNKLKTTKDIIKEVIETENDEVPDIATIHVNKETIGIRKIVYESSESSIFIITNIARILTVHIKKLHGSDLFRINF